MQRRMRVARGNEEFFHSHKFIIIKTKKKIFFPLLSKEDGNRFFTLQNCFFSRSLLKKENIFKLQRRRRRSKKKLCGEKNLINKTFSWNFFLFFIFIFKRRPFRPSVALFFWKFTHTPAQQCVRLGWWFDSSPSAATNSRVKICVFGNY